MGKTTLLTLLENELAGEVKLLDPGELFRRYCYHQRIKTPEEIEELLIEQILEMPHDSVVVLHWHYAVLRPYGYIPQISFARLKRIAESGKIEQIVLLLLEAPTDVVQERRQKDSKIKQRGLSILAIEEEVAAEEKFLAEERNLFSRILGDQKVLILRLNNVNLETTKQTLYKFLKFFLANPTKRGS